MPGACVHAYTRTMKQRASGGILCSRVITESMRSAACASPAACAHAYTRTRTRTQSRTHANLISLSHLGR